MNSVTDKLVKGLVHIDSLDVAIVDDQACLVVCVIEFLVEGHQVVHVWHEVFHMSDCSRNLIEQGLFVELFRGKESGPDTVTQAIQAAEEGREVVGAEKTLEFLILKFVLNPAALENCDIRD